MASYELTGKLIEKYDTIQRSATFKTREFVVEVSEEGAGRTFTNFVKFQCVQDRTSIVDSVNTGEDVKVSFNLRGSKWEKDGRVNYITNLDAWRIEKSLSGQPANEANYADIPPVPKASELEDDLPF